MTEYEVIGMRRYRGHPRGARFEADLPRDAEQRALWRGDIKVISRTPTTIQPGSYRLPRGWLNNNEEVT